MWKPIILDVECIVCNKTLQKINHDPRSDTRKMGKIINRRSRTPNWSLAEKQYLLELIKQRKEVVVTKNNNGPNHSVEKDLAWNEILRELFTKFGSKFSLISIKKVKTQWQNMKRIAREEIALVGPVVEKFSNQTMEVCHILDMIKNGVLVRDESLNNTTLTTDIVVKAECIDEDLDQPSFSGTQTDGAVTTDQQNQTIDKTSTSSEEISTSENDGEYLKGSDVNDFDNQDFISIDRPAKKNASCMTDTIQEENNINPFHRELQEFFRHTTTEKQIKMESLKEERCVVKAMRETAELNKIIAEQKLKHVLWLKKQEMSSCT